MTILLPNKYYNEHCRGYRDRGRPKNTWRRDLENEIWFKYSWRKIR